MGGKKLFKVNNIRKALLSTVVVFLISQSVSGVEIGRFEHLNTDDGLSQNSVTAAFCDHKGYMWFGTMNGLNRFDGYNFKIFRSQVDKNNVLTNNRIVKIWEDSRYLLWIQTHDGYMHYYNPETEEFTTIPFYFRSEEEKNSMVTCFHQKNRNEIWIGSSNSGIYHLQFDSVNNNYKVDQYLSRGLNSVTNNEIHFAIHDKNENVWAGTRQGLNKFSGTETENNQPQINHYYININFTSAVPVKDTVWFGTQDRGLLAYNNLTDQFIDAPASMKVLENKTISLLDNYKDNYLIIGTQNDGLFIYDQQKDKLKHYQLDGKSVLSVYKDDYGLLWVNTEKFGITQINPVKGTSRVFMLTSRDVQPLIDQERPYFYEDSQKNLWIGLFGSGLALYNRGKDEFQYFRNDPEDPTTISSNFVHCITEDKAGLLWVGTGQFNGGINKVIPANSFFRHILPKKIVTNMADNVIRSLYEDTNGNIWMATKSGKIYIYNSDYKIITVFEDLPLENKKLPGYNIYTIYQDKKGYIWLGSKGGGIAVSTRSLQDMNHNYAAFKFKLYQHQEGNPESLSNDLVYSIIEDHLGRIWIGTYGGGLNLVTKRTDNSLVCRHYNRGNSNISSDDVRQVFEDSRHRLWVATTFGLNLLPGLNPDADNISFLTFNYNPHRDSSISYNDVIQIFEDSKKNLWFGTFGGGIDRLVSVEDSNAVFEQYRHSDGLINDAVFGILEDKNGNLWFSTENGVSRLNYTTRKFDNYDKNNGLLSNNFCENTCLRTDDGTLIFGSTKGALVINSQNISKNAYMPPIVLTGFQLSNIEVDYNKDNAPFHKTIDYVNNLTLKYNQSSFSIEYAALSYFDPKKTKYSYKLENFDKNWNDVDYLRRATYTNLSPGLYVFKVKAANWDGTWTNEPRTLNITILPPWWRTSWAYAIYFVIFLILAEITRRILTKYNRMRNDLRVERRVNEIKLQFFTDISHEIRTPLTLILGPLEDIKRQKKLPAPIVHSVEIMDRNGKRMLRLVNQLLDFRKIQKNKMKLKVQQIEAVKFINEVCENFTHIATAKRYYFQC